MEYDITASFSDDLADVWDAAFCIASVHGCAEIRIEHVLHAFTSVAFAAGLLETRDIDVIELRFAAAGLIADCAGDACDEGEAPEPDEDVEAAAQLAIAYASSFGDQSVTTEDLIEVLQGFEAGDEALAGVVAVFQGGWYRRTGHVRNSADHPPMTVATRAHVPGGHGTATPTGTAVAITMPWQRRPQFHDELRSPSIDNMQKSGDGLSEYAMRSQQLQDRMDRIEQSAAEDRARLVHALHELTRQRELLPAATDWRSQMQSLAERIDAMSEARTSRPATPESPPAPDRDFAGSQAVSRQVDRRDTGTDQTQAAQQRHARERRDIDEQLALLASGMERQQREIERVTGILSRLAEHRAVDPPRPMDAGGMRTPMVRPHPARALVDRSGHGAIGPTGRTSSAQFANQSSNASDPATSTSRRSQNSRKISQRSRTRAAATIRARRRTRSLRRFSRLGLASLSRFGLRKWPVRRERSWWRALGDQNRFRMARARGARYRPFSERMSARPRKRGEAKGRSSNRDHGRPETNSESATKRFYLEIDDDIVDAPSIGPRTAERLRPARLFTVRDLLDADPEEVAAIVTARHITADAVRNWQDQARLVLTIPFLRGTHAQMLVGAGFRSPQSISNSDEPGFLAAVLKFAATREGQSVLRNGPPPEIGKIVAWMRNAADAEPQRAA